MEETEGDGPMSLDSYTDLLRYVESRGGEETDGTSKYRDDTTDAGIEAWREFTTRWPWLSLRKSPPGAFITVAPVTTLTLTIAAAGEAVGATLSAVYATSLVGRKIRPSGKAWAARITAHVAGTNALTLDAAPETVAAATASTIFQDEYDLVSDLGVFVDGIWTQDGSFVALKGEEWMKVRYSDPPSAGWPAKYFCRLTRRRIRFSTYPSAVERCEYPYNYEPADPTGAGALAIDAHLRPAFAEKWLEMVFQFKSDKREAQAFQRGEAKIRRAQVYEGRLLRGLGTLSSELEEAPYG